MIGKPDNLINVLSINVRGLGMYDKRKLMYNYFRENNADLILVQETHCQPKNNLEMEWGGTIYHSYGMSNARGVSIFLSRRLSGRIKDVSTKTDTQGRLLLLEFVLENARYAIVNVYGPNKDDPVFFEDMASMLEGSPAEHIIVGGDFNLVMDPEVDSKNRRDNQPNARKSLIKAMNSFNLYDIWRIRNPNVKDYTWFKLNPSNVFSRLDMFLINAPLVGPTREVQKTPRIKTDHFGMLLTIQIEDYKWGPGVWKFNNSHLNNPKFCEQTEKVLKRMIQDTSELNGTEAWEVIKVEAIKHCRKFSKKHAQKCRDQLDHLDTTLGKLYDDAKTNPCTLEISAAIDCIENEILEIKQNKVRGIIFRSKVNWELHGEKPSKFFFALEKRNYFSKNMKAIKNDQGIICKEQKTILNEQVKFYKNLYTSNREVSFSLQPTANECILTNVERDLLEADIDLNEIESALKGMANNKTPGLDGLTKEFYSKFFNLLGPPLIKMYHDCFDKGILPPSTRRGLITLIPKKLANILELKSWRPLTLLNLDFKLLAKSMATRINTVLPLLIGEQQTGFMKGRNIQDNIRRTFEVVEFAKDKQTPAVIMNIDFKKCFDLIEHKSIYVALNYFNFGNNFIQWSKLFFTEMYVQTQNFGFLSQPFLKERGTNQSCNYSPFCYIICGEIMARQLQKNVNIKGVNVHGIKCLISQFADDTTLYLNFDKNTLENVLSTLALITRNTGLCINYDKTSIYRIGSLANTNAKIYTTKELNWVDKEFESLGILVSSNVTEVCRKNYEIVIEKMCNSINVWSNRNGTIMGKILVINTLFESLYVYRLAVLNNMSEAQIKLVESLVDQYLWKGKRRIARKTLIKSKLQGGLRLFDLKTKQAALKINWIKKISNENFYKACFFHSTGLPPVEYVFKINLSARDATNICTKSFWTEVFVHWCGFNHDDRVNTLDKVLHQIIWMNTHIRIGGKPIVNTRFFSNNFTMIKDIVNPETKALYTYNQLRTKYNDLTISWLEYQSIVNAIPGNWKSILTDSDEGELENPSNSKCLFEVMMSQPKVSNYVYKCMIDDGSELPKYLDRLKERNVCTELSLEKFSKSFKHIYEITNTVKLRNFQYKLLLCKVPTNVELTEWKIVMDSSCTFCKEQNEDLVHLLLECKFSKRLWNVVKSNFENVCITPENIWLNSIHNQKHHISNTTCLILKQLI